MLNEMMIDSISYFSRGANHFKCPLVIPINWSVWRRYLIKWSNLTLSGYIKVKVNLKYIFSILWFI